MRPFPTRVCLFIATLLALCACGGPKDARFAPKELAVSGPVWPQETLPGKKTAGIYPIDAHEDSTTLCCWTAPQARVVVRKDRSARNLRVNFYIPNVPLFRSHAQTLTVLFPGYPERKTLAGLRPGFHGFDVNVPATLRNVHKPQLVMLDSAVQFVPLGANGPRYGILLVSIYFE